MPDPREHFQSNSVRHVGWLRKWFSLRFQTPLQVCSRGISGGTTSSRGGALAVVALSATMR